MLQIRPLLSTLNRIKIGFVLLSKAQNAIPSTRISVLNMLPYLRAANFDPHIVYEPDQSMETPFFEGLAENLNAENFKIVYFQKVHGDSVVKLAHDLRRLGIKTVYGVCDLVDVDMAEATDVTITVTEYLKTLYPASLQNKIFVVHDGIEQPTLRKTDWGVRKSSRTQPLRAVLVTSVNLAKLPVLLNPPSWLQVTIVGRYAARSNKWQRLREIRWQFLLMNSWFERWEFLKFLLNPRIKCVAWDANLVYAEMQQSDIGIIPIETNESSGAMIGWQVKSENRLSMKMALGLPVVVTPIPSYEPVVKHGENAFFANNAAEWLQALSALRDPALRKKIGQAARQTAVDKYSMTEQARLLIAILNDLSNQSFEKAVSSGLLSADTKAL